MGWFGGKSNVMKSRTRELNSQIERLEQQIANLEHVSTSRNATEIRTTPVSYTHLTLPTIYSV